MSNYARFISYEFLIETTIIDSNVDANLITKFIDSAQDMHIQQVIGFSLYTTLMNKIADGSIAGQYQFLLDTFIQKCQAQYVVYMALPYINYHLTNKSVSTKSSDNGQPSSLEEIQYLRKDIESTAQFYAQRIREYIINNPGFFPEYWATSGIDRITPKSNNYFGGIYLDNRMKIPYGVNITNDNLNC
jgi:hypothetical protein